MQTLEYIRFGLQTSRNLTLSLIDDLKDAPLQAPTARGGNPPIWILGHVTYAEANVIQHIIRGLENPLLAWKEVFGAKTEPTTELDAYPAWDELRTKFDAVREDTMQFLDSLTEADLEKPSTNCPEGREQMFGTIGSCLLVLTLHPMMHYGQLADARRMLQRPPLRA